MSNTARDWERGLRTDLKALLTRYDATLTVDEGKLVVLVDARKENSPADHPEIEINLGRVYHPARRDGSDE